MSFWKIGASSPLSLEDVDQQQIMVSSVGRMLPIYSSKQELLYAVQTYRVTVVVGETGSGKSTQIPQFLCEAGWGTMAVAEPRRIAAVSLASRVASEMQGGPVGATVGYSVKFDECFGAQTRVLYVTAEMLLSYFHDDPELRQFSVIMLDEVHERSLHSEVLLALIKKVMHTRRDLRLVVCSATVDAAKLQQFFQDVPHDTTETDEPGGKSATRPCCLMSVEGQQHPVTVYYMNAPTSNFLSVALNQIMQIHRGEPGGDILVFLPDRRHVEKLISLVDEQRDSTLRALPMFASLSMDLQLAAFEKYDNVRKVICSTDVAECSVTIPGVKFVIDSGWVKLAYCNPLSGSESVALLPISKASANQRSGRAGRESAGKAFRLYSEESFDAMEDVTIPEIQRSNLTQTILLLKSLRIESMGDVQFWSVPAPAAVSRAHQVLQSLGALDDNYKLTNPIGIGLARLPVDPQLGRMLVEAATHGCRTEAITIAAMLSIFSVFVFPKGKRALVDKARRCFGVAEGDHIALLNVYNSFIRNRKSGKWCSKFFINFRAMKRALQIRAQLERQLDLLFPARSSTTDDTVAIRKCILAGFRDNVAQLLPDGTYRERGGQTLTLHPECLLGQSPQWIVYHRVSFTSRAFVRHVSAIEESWLQA